MIQYSDGKDESSGGFKNGNVTTKTIKLTGVTASTQGGTVTIPTGYSTANVHVIGCKILLPDGSAVASDSYSFSTGNSFSIAMNNTGGITICNTPSNSSEILSKPVHILIKVEV